MSLLEEAAGDTGPGSVPLDAAFSNGGRYLYVRLGSGTLGAFRSLSQGGLESLGTFGDLPAGANGVIAF
jgi:hypothetical protein